MNEANRIVSVHEGASVGVLRRQIENALVDGNEDEALRLDNVLRDVECLMSTASDRTRAG